MVEDITFRIGSYTFGRVTDPISLKAGGWDTGGWSVRGQEAPNPGRDGRRFGREFLDADSWTMNLIAHGENVREELALFAQLLRADTVRKTPGAVLDLYYTIWGEERLAKVRVSKFAIEPDSRWMNDRKAITVELRPEQPYTYSAKMNSKILDLSAAYADDEGVNLFPDGAEFDWIFTEKIVSAENAFMVLGDSPAPFRLELKGPVSGAAAGYVVKTPGFSLTYAGTIQASETVVIDTWDGTCLLGKTSMVKNLPLTFSLNSRLSPGQQYASFAANDQSRTATAKLQWRETTSII